MITPINKLEALILAHPEIQSGLSWSRPSYGHPEKTVGHHVVDVLKNIDRLQVSDSEKERLRLAAITHDTFKLEEFKQQSKRHGLLAQKFMMQYTNDQLLLELLEWHDEAYHAWKIAFCHNNFVLAENRIQKVITHFGKNMDFFFHFFICDTATGDKNKHPIQWLKQKIEKYQD